MSDSEHPLRNAIAEAKALSRVAADQRARGPIQLVVIVWNIGNRHEAFNEMIDQFDRETVTPHRDDDRVKCFPKMLLHEKHLLPFEQFTLRLIREALTFARFTRDGFKLCNGNWRLRPSCHRCFEDSVYDQIRISPDG